MFLDEIANMPVEIQSKFLRAIQEGEVRPLGSNQVKKLDVRTIAASQDLRAQVRAGNFRQDLFYRLNVVPICLPPLRERREDIAILATHFLKKTSEKHRKKLQGFQPQTLVHLENHSWPGNVRELENTVERMTILAENSLEYATPDLLPEEILSPVFAPALHSPTDIRPSDVKTKKDVYEKSILLEALSQNDWNQSAAARALGIAESSLRYKMQKYSLTKP